ncbi:Translation initiation factor IF-2, partial [Diplodia seriata]
DIGSLLGFSFAARDYLRIAEMLNEDGLLRYYGLSGGTVLGATIAAMFPDRIERMVLDGVWNIHEYYHSQYVVPAHPSTFHPRGRARESTHTLTPRDPPPAAPSKASPRPTQPSAPSSPPASPPGPPPAPSPPTPTPPPPPSKPPPTPSSTPSSSPPSPTPAPSSTTPPSATPSSSRKPPSPSGPPSPLSSTPCCSRPRTRPRSWTRRWPCCRRPKTRSSRKIGLGFSAATSACGRRGWRMWCPMWRRCRG